MRTYATPRPSSASSVVYGSKRCSVTRGGRLAVVLGLLVPLDASFRGEARVLLQAIGAGRLVGDELEREVEAAGADELD